MPKGGLSRFPLLPLLAATWLAVTVPARLCESEAFAAFLAAVLATIVVFLDSPSFVWLGTYKHLPILLALSAGVSTFAAAHAIHSASSSFWGSSIEPSGNDRVLPDPLLLATTVLIAPFFEEYVFRRRLLDNLLLHLNIFSASVISAVLFALFHAHPSLMPTIFLAGLVLAFIRISTGNLVCCIAYHAGINIGIIFSIDSFTPTPLRALALTCLSLLLLLMMLRACDRLPASQGRP